MAEPVAQNDKGNADYIPTQVLADFLPDYGFADGPIDGAMTESGVSGI